MSEADAILHQLSDGAIVALLGAKCSPASVAELCALGLAVEQDGCWHRTPLGVMAQFRARML
jgi:hypothetical protein